MTPPPPPSFGSIGGWCLSLSLSIPPSLATAVSIGKNILFTRVETRKATVTT